MVDGKGRGKSVNNKTNILFYMAEYAQLDPNIVHSVDTLQKESYVLLNEEDAKRDEAASIFGTNIDVSIEKFDYDKIMHDFNFAQRPTINKIDGGYLILCNDVVLNISDNEMEKYKNHEIKTFNVYKKSIYRNIEDKEGLAILLSATYLTERGTFPNRGEGLRLSYAQIDTIDGKIEGFNLMSLYNRDEPNLFVCIS